MSCVVAVVGATGVVGREMLRTLEQRRFPADRVLALASPRSAGQKLPFRGRTIEVHAVTPEAFDGVRFALFSAGASASRELAPIAKELMRERVSPARLCGEAGKLLAALGRAALSTPNLVGQIEKIARTGSITVSIASKDLERLRGKERDGGADPQLYPAALAICAAILFASEPLMAGLLALVAVALALFERVKRR